MLLVKSYDKYNEYDDEGKHWLNDDSEILEITNGTCHVGTITAKELKLKAERYAKSGGTLPYINYVSDGYILSEERIDVQYLYYIIVDKDGGVTCIHENEVKIQTHEGTNNRGSSISLEFNNGIVLGIFDFKLVQFSDDFGTISFRLFGSKETFVYEEEFNLSLFITECTDDRVSGYAKVFKLERDVEGTGRLSGGCIWLGDFTCSKSGSSYRDVESDVVYDRTRFVKELMLGG